MGKETAVNQYLSPLSCHPNSVGRNIPYSLAFRIKRICSEDFDFERQLVKLKGMLMDRGYRERIVDNAFNRVRALTREHTLEKVVKEPSEKLTFVITYDPRLPPIPSVCSLVRALTRLKALSTILSLYPLSISIPFSLTSCLSKSKSSEHIRLILNASE